MGDGRGRSVHVCVCVWRWPEVWVCVCVCRVFLRNACVHVHEYNPLKSRGVACSSCIHITDARLQQKIHVCKLIFSYSSLSVSWVCTTVSYSRDDQWGGEEQSSQQAAPAVCILPLTLVHLTAAVVTAAAHAEEKADHRHQNGEQQAHRCTHKEAYLVVDGLGSAAEEWQERGDEEWGTNYLGNKMEDAMRRVRSKVETDVITRGEKMGWGCWEKKGLDREGGAVGE